MLGPIDLMVNMAKCDDKGFTATDSCKSFYAGWVDTLGYAMIEYISTPHRQPKRGSQPSRAALLS